MKIRVIDFREKEMQKVLVDTFLDSIFQFSTLSKRLINYFKKNELSLHLTKKSLYFREIKYSTIEI
jgi:hypothetical protein